MNIIFHRGKALANVDSKRFFIETIWGTKKCFNFDLYKSQIHFNTLSGSSMLFSLTGISLNISKKILDYSKKCIHKENGNLSLHFYCIVETVHNFLSGNWQKDFDFNIIDRGLQAGDTFSASFNLGFLGYQYIELGDFASTERILQKLRNVSDEYNDEQATVMFYEVSASLFLKKRKIDSALNYYQNSIALLDKIRMGMRGIKGRGMIAYMQVLKDDLPSAKRTLEETKNLIKKIGKDRIPFYTYLFFVFGTFFYHLAKLEKAILSNDRADISEFKKVALVSGKNAIKKSKKVASVRTETYRLMGTYYWIIDKQKKALKCWGKSMKEAQRLGARPDLARTYMEIGKRFLEKKSKYKELNGISTKEYLEKAMTMFQEMDLQSELDELDRISLDS
jgi:tetratricopeptide (TPR) repeat protein